MEKILILDFGSQYTQLIARRVREAEVFSELHAWDMSEAAIRDFAPSGIILSGGPSSVYDEETPQAPQVVFELGVPVLGICYGMQTMAAQLGGIVETGHVREFGHAEVSASGVSPLLAGIADAENGVLDVWMSHGDKVAGLPEGFHVLCSNDATPIAGMGDEKRRFYGLQFHPEVTHTQQGKAILSRFVHDICACGRSWTIPAYIDTAVAHIREQVGDEEVILGLSGGVDSSVAAALLQRAIGDQLICVFVDNGLLRLNEAEQVMTTFADHLGVRVDHVDASAAFLKHLAGVTDPEAKRKIIGREFVEVFQTEAEKMPNAKWLAQGTIYPDVIESADSKTKKAHTIKSHHNVGGLPET
ncbi:MAG: glutamine-hydrolyzing GMP synthase, partial [Mariprofundaceae bacterium]|nr:glutamine-hydrolyzing GMP synthase [Mariprofundaceae bacterium]